VSGLALAGPWARSGRLVGRRVGGEMVLVSLTGGGADLDRVLNLNEVGTFIWERLDGVATGADVVEAVIARFEVERAEAEADTLEFIGRLLALEAVVAAPTGGRGGESPPGRAASLTGLCGRG